jgi:hypothetical protein
VYVFSIPYLPVLRARNFALIIMTFVTLLPAYPGCALQLAAAQTG